VDVRRQRGEGVVIALEGGGVARYGPPADLGQKSTAVASMLTWADRHGVRIAYVDVSVPSAPVLKPAPGRG
jgi:hypothetical protein